jgi:hypothetical protein
VTAQTPEQAAHAAACAHQGISAGETAELWRRLGNDDATYWADIAEAVLAAREQPPPGDRAFRADLVDAMLLWSGRDREDADECAAELAAILDKHPAPQPAPGLAALRHGIAALAADLSASADATRPSRKSQLEDEFAIALRRLLESGQDPELPAQPAQEQLETHQEGTR